MVGKSRDLPVIPEPIDRSLLTSNLLRNAFLGAIRTGTTLSESVKETAITRVAVLNKAWYEFEHHAPLALNPGGLPLEGLKCVLTSTPRQPQTVNKEIGIDEQHAAVLEYTDYMTLDCEVPQEVFDRLKAVFSEREVVEITATVGAYNCVSRFLVALNVNERNGEVGMREALKHVHPELEKLTPAKR
jgi:alkylhydroperoxidase family enzyme